MSSQSNFIKTSDLRREFSNKLSAMYAAEVPLYAQLIEVVKQVNRQFIATHPELGLRDADIDHISEERHGAIRLGRDIEMYLMANFFEVLGMHPVNFYDLSAAGAKAQGVISTAFRAVDLDEINVSPFRVFCSLLRPDDERFFEDPDLRQRMKDTLAQRDIFSPRLRELMGTAKTQGGLNRLQAEAFLEEGVKLFKWRGEAVNKPLYDELMEKGLNIAADICCFPNPHLNHLTPSTLDIEALQVRMVEALEQEYKHLKAQMKEHIEGPPVREVLILLRQTSYKALTEKVTFDGVASGAHTARFGEIEQRGVALTTEGRKRYDAALAKIEAIRAEGKTPTIAEIKAAYAELPDDMAVLRKQGLGFFTYEVTEKGLAASREGLPKDLDQLVEQGFVQARPIRYEDFLPVNAAGIFASNLGVAGAKREGPSPYTKRTLEAILGRDILESTELYAAQEARSIVGVYNMLGVALTNGMRMRLESAIKDDPAAKLAGHRPI